MSRKLLAGLAAGLVALALIVMPADAAPRWFVNGKLAGTQPEPGVTFGKITLHNATLKNLECGNFVATTTWNEVVGGTERGFENTVGYSTWQCKAELPCKVHNERGEEEEGIFATPEGPPTFDGTEKRAVRSGITSLPWTGELTEKEKGVRQVLTHHVKVWLVVPIDTRLGGPGEGPACELLGGQEIEFADREGKTEKAEGDELAPRTVNGISNGLTPSHAVFAGEKVGKEESEKGGKAPETGRLISKYGPGYTTGTLVTAGAGDFELATSE
jgi:hypothetical protein